MEYLSGRVTARFNVLQYERTLDTLKYIHTKDPFHRENESASVLAFLDETHPDTREFTLGGYRMEMRRNLKAVQQVDPIHQNESLILPRLADGQAYEFNPADNPYERSEVIKSDETE